MMTSAIKLLKPSSKQNVALPPVKKKRPMSTMMKSKNEHSEQGITEIATKRSSWASVRDAIQVQTDANIVVAKQAPSPDTLARRARFRQMVSERFNPDKTLCRVQGGKGPIVVSSSKTDSTKTASSKAASFKDISQKVASIKSKSDARLDDAEKPSPDAQLAEAVAVYPQMVPFIRDDPRAQTVLDGWQ